MCLKLGKWYMYLFIKICYCKDSSIFAKADKNFKMSQILDNATMLFRNFTFLFCIFKTIISLNQSFTEAFLIIIFLKKKQSSSLIDKVS